METLKTKIDQLEQAANMMNQYAQQQQSNNNANSSSHDDVVDADYTEKH